MKKPLDLAALFERSFIMVPRLFAVTFWLLDKFRVLDKYKISIIDEIDYLPMDIQGASLFFHLIARRYEKMSTVFTPSKTFSQWNEVFAGVTISGAPEQSCLVETRTIDEKRYVLIPAGGGLEVNESPVDWT